MDPASQERLNRRFTQALQQTGAAAAAAAGAGGGSSSAAPANDFARSLPVMPRKSRASPALSKSRKRKSSVASDKDSDSEAESADVMTMLAQVQKLKKENVKKKMRKGIEAKASQLASGVRRAATVDLKAAILSVESAEKDMAAELTASKHRVSDTLRELGDLYEKRKEHWNRRREEVTAFIAAICDNHTKISAVEAQYAQQAEAATRHLREQVEAKVAEVEQDVEEINSEQFTITDMFGDLARQAQALQ